MRSWEELASPEPGVEAACHGLQHPETQQYGARIEVPIPIRTLQQRFPFLIQSFHVSENSNRIHPSEIWI